MQQNHNRTTTTDQFKFLPVRISTLSPSSNFCIVWKGQSIISKVKHSIGQYSGIWHEQWIQIPRARFTTRHYTPRPGPSTRGSQVVIRKMSMTSSHAAWYSWRADCLHEEAVCCSARKPPDGNALHRSSATVPQAQETWAGIAIPVYRWDGRRGGGPPPAASTPVLGGRQI